MTSFITGALLADRLFGVIDTALDESDASPTMKTEALAAAVLAHFGLSRPNSQSWQADGVALAQLVQAIGYACDRNVGGPCAMPPGTVLGVCPPSLRLVHSTPEDAA